MNLNDDYAGRCRDCDADIYEDDDYYKELKETE